MEERVICNNERKPCFIKEFGECFGTYCDECIRDTYNIRKASYDKGYADCIKELEGYINTLKERVEDE